jgi:hypothetical protein
VLKLAGYIVTFSARDTTHNYKCPVKRRKEEEEFAMLSWMGRPMSVCAFSEKSMTELKRREMKLKVSGTKHFSSLRLPVCS